MATPKTIPSKLNRTETVTAGPGQHVYITAILKGHTLQIDELTVSNNHIGSFDSPIKCKSFTGEIGHIAYFISF